MNATAKTKVCRGKFGCGRRLPMSAFGVGGHIRCCQCHSAAVRAANQPAELKRRERNRLRRQKVLAKAKTLLSQGKKVCRWKHGCGRAKPLAAFGHDSGYPDGLAIMCRRCLNNRRTPGLRERESKRRNAAKLFAQKKRRCSKCNRVKGLRGFSYSLTRGEYHPKCKSCRRLSARGHRKTQIRKKLCCHKSCGKMKLATSIYCGEHHRKHKARRDAVVLARRNQGLCLIQRCKEPKLSDSRFCEKHWRRHLVITTNRYNARTEVDLCRYKVCGKTRLPKSAFCEVHYCHSKVGSLRRRTQGKFNIQKLGGQILAKFHKQKGRCYLTGVPIALSINAEIDHVKSHAKGGSSSSSNLRWTHHIPNRMKNHYSLKEFVEWCRLIADHLGHKDQNRLASNLATTRR